MTRCLCMSENQSLSSCQRGHSGKIRPLTSMVVSGGILEVTRDVVVIPVVLFGDADVMAVVVFIPVAEGCVDVIMLRVQPVTKMTIIEITNNTTSVLFMVLPT
jgi:hypothetical protein